MVSSHSSEQKKFLLNSWPIYPAADILRRFMDYSAVVVAEDTS
jgi:hypothetical protein